LINTLGDTNDVKFSLYNILDFDLIKNNFKSRIFSCKNRMIFSSTFKFIARLNIRFIYDYFYAFKEKQRIIATIIYLICRPQDSLYIKHFYIEIFLIFFFSFFFFVFSFLWSCFIISLYIRIFCKIWKSFYFILRYCAKIQFKITKDKDCIRIWNCFNMENVSVKEDKTLIITKLQSPIYCIELCMFAWAWLWKFILKTDL
jgi:hypothetical protein